MLSLLFGQSCKWVIFREFEKTDTSGALVSVRDPVTSVSGENSLGALAEAGFEHLTAVPKSADTCCKSYCLQSGILHSTSQDKIHTGCLTFLIPCARCSVTSVMSDSLQPHDCNPPGSSVHGDSPGKNTGVGCHALLQGIFPTQGSNPGLPHCRWILYCLSHKSH